MKHALHEAAAERRWYYVAGEPLELWENADSPFGWSDGDLERYATGERWDLLFNALVLATLLESSPDAGAPPEPAAAATRPA